MKEFYAAPSVAVYSLVSHKELANNVCFDDLLVRSSEQKENISMVGSDINIPFRDQ